MILNDHTNIKTAWDARVEGRYQSALAGRYRRPGSGKNRNNKQQAYEPRDTDYVEFQDPRHLDIGPCHIWLWNASLSWCLTPDQSYPRVSHLGKTTSPARLINQTPEGLDTRHICRNRLCIRQEHLTSGSRSDNEMDKHRDLDTGLAERSLSLKVTQTQCREMRDLYAAGMYQKDIGLIYGVDQKTVGRHVNGPGYGCSHEI